MVGIIWLAAFLLEGELIARRALSGYSSMIRIWIGAAIGFVMAMWLPVICAFPMRFTVAAQWTALAIGAVGALGATLFVKPSGQAHSDDAPSWGAMLAVTLPLLAIGAYLQYTHNLRVVDGGYNVGQSTYSDINLHLSIVTGIKNAAFPPEYVILPGTRLCYPFLTDSLSGSMYILGTDLSACLALPSTIMMELVFMGYACIAWQLSKKTWITVLCVLLLFVNGGFGFIDMIDMGLKDPSNFIQIFTGYYKTPTNLPDLNLRWSNILVDLLVPQRTFLAGWTVLLPVLYLVLDATRYNKRKVFIGAGILAGCMPMINTHAFLALGLCSIGFMCWQLAHLTKRAKRSAQTAPDEVASIKRARREMFINYAAFGLIALALAVPQVLIWTIHQATQGGFVKLHFNWVNNDGGLIDEYFWFWIKNIGPVALFIIPALLDSRGEQRMVAVGAFCIFAVAECVVFQPLVYDNNKLYYVWYLLMLPVAMRYVQRIGQGMKRMKLRGLPLLLGLFVFCGLFAGSLTIGRELISDYPLYTADDVTAMKYVDEYAPQDAVFLAGGQHNNAVSTLTGRKLVCGSETYLYFHGLNYAVQQADAAEMFSDPTANADLFDKYKVDYIYISVYERKQFDIDADKEAQIAAKYPLWYSLGDINIYAVSERARASGAQTAA